MLLCLSDFDILMAGLFPSTAAQANLLVSELFCIACHYSVKLQFGLGGRPTICIWMNQNHETALPSMLTLGTKPTDIEYSTFVNKAQQSSRHFFSSFLLMTQLVDDNFSVIQCPICLKFSTSLASHSR